MFSNSKTKRILVLLLSLIMLISIFPVSVFAGEVPDVQEPGKNGKIKKFVSQGVLGIYGEDEMTDFYINYDDVSTTAPWTDLRDQVTTIVIENGVKSIGRFAFNAFSKLTEVYLPRSITNIGPNAFAKCDALKTVCFEQKKTDTDWGFSTEEGNDAFMDAEWKFGVSYSSTLTYTVRFNANGGTGTMKDQKINLYVEKALSANAFTRSGYDFNGWNTKKDGSGKAYKNKATVKDLAKADQTVTLYAQWKKTVYTVRFIANGASGTMDDISVKIGASKALPANKFKRSCYSFTGWNTKKDGSGTAYKNKATVKNLSTKAGATVKLYAQWKLKSGCYTIKYTLNGGTNNSANPEAYDSKGNDVKLKNPTKTGYTFGGWFKKSDFSGSKVTKIAASTKKNVKLYAKWTVNKYTVKFNANGGTGTMSAKKYVYGKTYTLPANAFKKSGNYVFLGWNTKKDGSGTAYANKAKVKNLSSKNGATKVLYAQWGMNVSDKKELEKVFSILARTCEPLYLKRQNNNPSAKYDSGGAPVWTISTRANGTWKYVNAYDPTNRWSCMGSTYCSAWSTPYLTMSVMDDNAETFRSQLLNGTYDFKNDPGYVLVGWSMYSSSTTKSDFQKMINNKISDEAFDAAIAKYNARTSSVYGGSCVIVYGKDTDGKLIGKYAGSIYYNNASNAAMCYFVGINPKNIDDYGKTTSKTVFYG